MEIERTGSDIEMEREEEDDEETLLLRDRFRLSAISIAESEGLLSLSISLLSSPLSIGYLILTIFLTSEEEWNAGIGANCCLYFQFGVQLCR